MTNKLPNPFMFKELTRNEFDDKFPSKESEYVQFVGRASRKLQSPKVPRSRPSNIKRKPKGK